MAYFLIITDLGESREAPVGAAYLRHHIIQPGEARGAAYLRRAGLRAASVPRGRHICNMIYYKHTAPAGLVSGGLAGPDATNMHALFTGTGNASASP